MKKVVNKKVPKDTLYERLGGVYAIAAVIDRFDGDERNGCEMEKD